MTAAPHALPDEPPGADAATPRRNLTLAIEREALNLGFASVGFAPLSPLERGREKLEQFRAAGYAGTMRYLESGARHDARELLAGAKSAVVVALAYGEPGLVPLRTSEGRIAGSVARYARGADYHQVIKGKLHRLAGRIELLLGRPLSFRACVDTAPLLERELARVAGVGFQAKSTMLIAPGLGSFFLLGELLVDVELEPSRDGGTGCGACRACLDACPTGAFTAEHVLDASRCIAYLTIEYDGLIPRELRSAIGTRVFGCDVCQDVCPFNASKRPRQTAPELQARATLEAPDLVELLNLGSAAYRKLVRGTALRRASRSTLQRNAAVALGNSGQAGAVEPLIEAVVGHTRALVRAHAVWALAEHRPWSNPKAVAALRAAERDDDPVVRGEAVTALAAMPRSVANAPRI